jgi:glycerol-3-phosphate acyltransferase PlsX
LAVGDTNRPHTIALDLMGGEHAPKSTIEGALKALESGVTVHAFGTEEAVNALLTRWERPGLTVTVCSQAIQDHEHPLKAIREKEDSSIHQGLLAVKEGLAGAFVSAGSTGAMVAGGVVILGRATGVDKPCMGQVLPTADGKGVFFVDLGASSDARPHTLVQFAILGKVYAMEVLGWKDPSVRLLNIGAESEKGNALYRKAYSLLAEKLEGFSGNIEARDVFSGKAQVVVADGFTGNVFLKACEGTSAFLLSALRSEVTSTFARKAAAGVLRPAFSQVKALLDYTAYGGAPLLGLTGCVIKCHGSSDREAILNGIGQARAFLEKDVASIMMRSLSESVREEE